MTSLVKAATALSTKKFTQLLLTSKVGQKWPLIYIKRFTNKESLYANAQPANYRKTVGLWLLGCAGLTYAGVGLDGMARLTEAGGISLCTWTFFRTKTPPTTDKEWEKEFKKYKNNYEYKHNRKGNRMSFDDFKSIWTLEYTHHWWLRGLGVAFLLPCAYFWSKGRFDSQMKVRMGLAGALVASQALMARQMVKTGKNMREFPDKRPPHKDHYHLLGELGMAYALYTIFLWNGLTYVLRQHDHTFVQGINKFRWMVRGTKGAIFSTVLVGGLVAGIDAGLVYNHWPLFNGKLIPDEILEKKPTWRNFTENPVTVQFMHRHLAYLTLASVTMTWLAGHRSQLNSRAKFALHSLMLVAYTQAALGISTLVYHVPVWLSTFHQSGSFALVTAILWLSNEIRRIPK